MDNPYKNYPLKLIIILSGVSPPMKGVVLRGI